MKLLLPIILIAGIVLVAGCVGQIPTSQENQNYTTVAGIPCESLRFLDENRSVMMEFCDTACRFSLSDILEADNLTATASAYSQYCHCFVCNATQKQDIEPIINKSWKNVTEFTGSSSRKTEMFAINGDWWRYTWSCVTNTPEYDGLNIAVYKEGETMYTDFRFLLDCQNSTTTYIYEGRANFYFDIMEANIENWIIRVEDYY